MPAQEKKKKKKYKSEVKLLLLPKDRSGSACARPLDDAHPKKAMTSDERHAFAWFEKLCQRS